MKITMSALTEASNEFFGYCRTCKSITEFGGVDPDAIDDRCPDCAQSTLMGVQEAFIQGFIVGANDDDDDPRVFKL